jgi:septum site-determining protein MinC
LVQIKGVRDGLLATLGDGSWAELNEALLQQVSEGSSFFKGARLALDVGNQALHAVELGSLRDALSDRGVSLWAVISTSQVTENTAQVLGMATRLSAPRAERTVRVLDTQLTGESAILVQRPQRSGYKVSHQGHVVVIGDVNPGAEVIAGGSIVVWGRLRGAAHAGADGDQAACVCALGFEPTQLRIAGQIAQTTHRRGKPQPEIASLVNGQVATISWNPKGK